MKDHLFSGQHGRKHTKQNRAHFQTWWSLHNCFWQKQQKLSRDPRGFPLFRAGFVPLPKPPVRLLVVGLNWNKEAMWAAAESSSHQGTGRSEKKMLFSMWEQQECPRIMKDCVKFSLEEPLSGKKCPSYSKRSCGETNNASYLIDNHKVELKIGLFIDTWSESSLYCAFPVSM